MKTNQEKFKLFESILTYAVDENPDSAIRDCEELFSEKVFFEKAYIERSKKEIELEEEILKDSDHTYFIGQPGTGKTTILRKVLNKIKSERDALLFTFDFKKIPL